MSLDDLGLRTVLKDNHDSWVRSKCAVIGTVCEPNVDRAFYHHTLGDENECALAQ